MALTGLLMGCSSTDPVATVGDAKITEEELTDSLVMQYGAEVLDILISNKIVELEAEKAKISVTNDEIEEEYKTYIDYYGNEETLTKTLESYGMSTDKFRDELQSSILTEKVLASTIKITDNELEMFFEENKANYTTVEQVEASHIVVEDEATANKVVEQLNAGEEFAKLAEQYSTDSSSSENGGELGRFGRGAMEGEFEEIFEQRKCTISRIGGDEFMIYVPGLTDREEIEKVSERIIGRLDSKMSRSGLPTIIGTSIGVAINEGYETAFDKWYKKVDSALYYAKEHGKNDYKIYE